jgi:hypothetical protein
MVGCGRRRDFGSRSDAVMLQVGDRGSDASNARGPPPTNNTTESRPCNYIAGTDDVDDVMGK